MSEPSVCANEECLEDFVPKRPGQVFCSIECRNAQVSRESAKRRGDTVRGTGSSPKTRYVKRDRRPEHIVVYEENFGPIPEGYVVHHMNGDKRDNRPSNLILMSSQSEHAKLHARDRGKVTW